MLRIEGAKLRLGLVEHACSPCEAKYASDFAGVLRDSVGEMLGRERACAAGMDACG